MNLVLEQYVIEVQELASQRNFQRIPDLVTTASQLFNAPQLTIATLNNVLETFNNFQHSFGVLQILIAKHHIIQNSDSYTELFDQTRRFIKEANAEQIAYTIDMFCDLCHTVATRMINKGTPIKAIPVLMAGIDKLQKEPSDLTALHSELCQLCLLAQCFQPALKYLDADITDIVKSPTQTAKNFLLFFYYGGMIYTALKKFDRAIFFFESAVTTDSLVVSHIVLEAYKKRILVSLIAKGSVEELPIWTSQVVARFAHQVTKVYEDLSTLYSNSSISEVREHCATNSDHFSRDGNTGLIKQLIASLYRKNIKKLTKTFVTLSLADVAQRCQLEDARQAERFLVNMIEDGEIFATINQKDGMVVFKDNPNKYNNPDCFRELETNMRRYININEKIRNLSEAIILDPQFFMRTGQEEEASGGVPSTSSTSSRAFRLPSSVNEWHRS